MWLVKQTVLLLFIFVMMAAWDVPSLGSWGFWIGLLAFSFYVSVEKSWRT